MSLGGVTVASGVTAIDGVSYAGATSLSSVTITAGVVAVPVSSNPAGIHVLDETGNFVTDESGNRILTG